MTEREFMLQWHLTDNCEMNCEHCYLGTIRKQTTRKYLVTSQCFQVIDQFSEMANTLGFNGLIYFTGGNPLMRSDFFTIANYAKSVGHRIGILGNPSSALDKHNIEKLQELGIKRYQISLDGMKETHEKVRGPLTFAIAKKGIETLVKNNISVAVMSTVTRQNANELPEVMQLSSDLGASVYAFARLVPIGNGKNLFDTILTANEYRDFLVTMLSKYETIGTTNPNFYMPYKDPLFKLLFKERGEFIPEVKLSDNIIVNGCSVGISSMCLDVDGTVHNCRRLEEKVGNVLEQSLQDIFLYSDKLNESRKVEQIKGCKDCELLPYCRGCRAIAKAVNGSFFSKDPQCWRKELTN